MQLNSNLYAKTLIRKDITFAASSKPKEPSEGQAAAGESPKPEEPEADFATKSQVMNLMGTDIGRISNFAYTLMNLCSKALPCSWHFVRLRFFTVSGSG